MPFAFRRLGEPSEGEALAGRHQQLDEILGVIETSRACRHESSVGEIH
jgi:hypothetical protein